MRPFWSIKDARGVTRRIGLSGWSTLAGRERLSLLSNTLSIVITLGLIASAFYLSARSWHAGSRAEPYRSLSLFGMAIVLVLAIRGWYRHFRAHGKTIAGARLRLHRCPTCNYTLDGIEPDDRNARTCPECSATWELPPRPPKYHD